MKKNCYNTFPAILTLLFAFLFIPKSDACVDPNTIITTTVNFNADFTEMEVRLGNLMLHAETPNIFCSCALSAYDEAFTQPNYIAFVYAGTNNPYPNFDVWENTVEADDAWDEEFPAYPDWSGYISEVIGTGLSVDDEVEMVIRVSTPPGTYASSSDLDSTFSLMTLGTDMWLPDEGMMAFDHPGIRNIRHDVSSFTMNEVDGEYFEMLDNGIISSDEEIEQVLFDLTVFPNPVKNKLWVEMDLPRNETVHLSIKDIAGRLIGNLYEEDLPEGKQTIPLELNSIIPEHGIYLLEIKIGEQVGVRKFVK